MRNRCRAAAAVRLACGRRDDLVPGASKLVRLDHQPVSSHPLATDLGIADQEIKVGFKIEMNFRQDVGRVLWDAFDPTVVF